MYPIQQKLQKMLIRKVEGMAERRVERTPAVSSLEGPCNGFSGVSIRSASGKNRRTLCQRHDVVKRVALVEWLFCERSEDRVQKFLFSLDRGIELVPKVSVIAASEYMSIKFGPV